MRRQGVGKSLRRIEVGAIASVLVVYGLVLILWVPQYFEVVKEFAPLYPHHQPEGPVLLSGSWRLVAVLLAVAAALIFARPMVPSWAEVHSLLALGLTAAVYLGGKGWRYQWFPAVACTVTLLGGCAALVVLGQIAPATESSPWRWGSTPLYRLSACWRSRKDSTDSTATPTRSASSGIPSRSATRESSSCRAGSIGRSR